ncbi:MAG: excinuclease ABC subunit UvrC, partial [bacterium]|nr:excinuclease ABC subunit UvrC [bacterium]
LILVDGGKAQRNSALRAMRDAGVEIPLVALAKREEDVYLPGETHPLRLSRHSLALQLLQRVRDEAHRFAIAYHRERYRKRMVLG